MINQPSVVMYECYVTFMTVYLTEAEKFLLQHSPVFHIKNPISNIVYLGIIKLAVQISHTSEALKHNLPTRFIKTHF